MAENNPAVEEAKVALAAAKEDIARKAKLIAALRKGRTGDGKALAAAEARVQELEDKIRRCTLELGRRKGAMEELRARLRGGDGPAAEGTSCGGRACCGYGKGGDEGETDALREKLKAATLDKARLKQQVNVLKAKIDQQGKEIAELQGTAEARDSFQDRLKTARAAVAQKDSLLVASKQKLEGKSYVLGIRRRRCPWVIVSICVSLAWPGLA